MKSSMRLTFRWKSVAQSACSKSPCSWTRPVELPCKEVLVAKEPHLLLRCLRLKLKALISVSRGRWCRMGRNKWHSSREAPLMQVATQADKQSRPMRLKKEIVIVMTRTRQVECTETTCIGTWSIIIRSPSSLPSRSLRLILRAMTSAWPSREVVMRLLCASVIGHRFYRIALVGSKSMAWDSRATKILHRTQMQWMSKTILCITLNRCQCKKSAWARKT